MTLIRPTLFAALLCGVSAVPLRAQQGPPPPEARHHQGPPPSPLFDALDTNHDGVISAEEIANASASLKALLKNGSDHLTREDLRPADAPPPRPEGADENTAPPRAKFGSVRPHGPPLRQREEDAPEPGDGPHLHPPAPGSAGDDGPGADRPRFRRDWQRDHPPRPEDDESGDAPAPLHRERMSAPPGAPRPEDAAPPMDATRPYPRRPHPDRAGQPDDDQAPPPRPRHAPPSPLFDALDTNHDGVISPEEIANASAALKGLLKNGSDHLTRDDLRPAGPPPEGR